MCDLIPQRLIVFVELGGRLEGLERSPVVVLTAYAGSERPGHIRLRIFVPLSRNAGYLLFEIHAPSDISAFPVEHFPLGVRLSAEEHVSGSAARSAFLGFASQQDRFVPGDIAEDGDDVHVGLQGVEGFTIERKVLVRLQ